MGKKRIATQKGTIVQQKDVTGTRALQRLARKKIAAGTLHVEATFNNTKATFTDTDGNTLFWSSTGALGFKGAKKGTPFAASKVGDVIGEKAKAIGIQEAHVVVRGVGSGREPTIRGFMAHNITIHSIKDRTPVPHNGVRPPKPRRV